MKTGAIKLVLFDIDGTIIYHVGPRKWEAQYEHGLQKAYGIKGSQNIMQYNGSIERHVAWEITQKYGFSRDEFLKRFPQYIDVMHEHLQMWEKKGPVFRVIPDAVALVQKLFSEKKLVLGVLTGNAKRIANWKLTHTGLVDYFSFGMYGDEADDRVALAKLVFEKAEKVLHMRYKPSDIVVIGDTVHDIRCAKAIGASVIAVTTGMHADPSVLEAEKPDLVVPTLADPRVLHFFGLT